MSPASYLTAPPRVAAPNCSTVTMREISLLTLFSLLFLVVAIVGSGAVLVLRGLARSGARVKSLSPRRERRATAR